MGIPKRREKLASEEKIAKAVEIATRNTEISEQVEVAERKKTGRKPIAGQRHSRITFYLTEETDKRFNLALHQEQYKQAQKGIKMDKSLIIETALKGWMESNGY